MSDYQGSESIPALGCQRSIAGVAPGNIAKPARRSPEWYASLIRAQAAAILARKQWRNEHAELINVGRMVADFYSGGRRNA